MADVATHMVMLESTEMSAVTAMSAVNEDCALLDPVLLLSTLVRSFPKAKSA